MLPDIEGAGKGDSQEDAYPSNAFTGSEARESARAEVGIRMLRIYLLAYSPGLRSFRTAVCISSIPFAQLT